MLPIMAEAGASSSSYVHSKGGYWHGPSAGQSHCAAYASSADIINTRTPAGRIAISGPHHRGFVDAYLHKTLLHMPSEHALVPIGIALPDVSQLGIILQEEAQPFEWDINREIRT